MSRPHLVYESLVEYDNVTAYVLRYYRYTYTNICKTTLRLKYCRESLDLDLNLKRLLKKKDACYLFPDQY